MGDTATVVRLLHGVPEDPAQPSWGGRYVRAWPRPSAAVDRVTTRADQIELFGILELALPVGPEAPASVEARMAIENQSLIGHFGPDRRMHFRFSPKDPKVYSLRHSQQRARPRWPVGRSYVGSAATRPRARRGGGPAALVDRRSVAGTGRGRPRGRPQREPVARRLPEGLRGSDGARPVGDTRPSSASGWPERSNVLPCATWQPVPRSASGNCGRTSACISRA